MCGRTACTLDSTDICRACSYQQNKTGKYQIPGWKDAPGGQQYLPSHNVAPTSHTPVMLSRSHLEPEADPKDRVIQPMLWGMIPKWHKGDYKSHGFSTINCRYETLMDKRLYKVPFNKGQRCVVLCDGFYEWQAIKGNKTKQPYFIYLPQPEGVCVEEPSTWQGQGDKLWSEENGWKGPRLLRMAGIFDTWRAADGEKPIFSYTIITLEASSSLSWLHHRMPAILEHEEAIQDWLDYGNVSSTEAVSLIKPIKDLTWHPVSTVVGNTRNKDPSCNKPISLEKPKLSASGRFMSGWLKSSSQKAASVSKTGSGGKIVKQEHEEDKKQMSSGIKTEKEEPAEKRLKKDE